MSKKIEYKLFDGKIVELDVSDEFAERYAEFEHDEKRRYRNEKERKWEAGYKEVSLDGLVSMGFDWPDPVNGNPEDIVIAHSEIAIATLGNLTDYQKRVAAKYYSDNKPLSQIAREEGKQTGDFKPYEKGHK